MTINEYNKVKDQLKTLKELQEIYGHKTLRNIIQGLEMRLKEFDNEHKINK